MADLYHRLNEKSEFRSFSNGDSGWLSYSQNSLEVSFCSFILSLFGQLKNLTRTLSESSFCDRFLPSSDCKKPNFSHFWDLCLADTLIAARRSHRQILAIPLVLWCNKKKVAAVTVSVRRRSQKRALIDHFSTKKGRLAVNWGLESEKFCDEAFFQGRLPPGSKFWPASMKNWNRQKIVFLLIQIFRLGDSKDRP